jgi:hypothetical protein
LPRLPAVADNAAMEAEPSKTDPPKRKRRWFQFSLRTLLVFTLICAIACAWIERRIEQKHREREAIEEILKTGGAFYYRFDNGNGNSGFDRAVLRSESHWFQNLSDDQFENTPTLLMFGGAYANPKPRMTIDNRVLSGLKSLPFLRGLDLSQTIVRDTDLVNLRELTQLKILDLRDTEVTHEAIVELRKALPNCQINTSVYSLVDCPSP